MAQATLVKRGAYHDSVALLTLARALRARPGVREAAVVMGTPANCDLLAQAGLLTEEARVALSAGLNVILWGDNVSLVDEIALKRQALARGLLLMGPDCGTAHVADVPLGFANAVPPGRVGLVAASGTGLQQVATLLAGCGHGISHAIGVGGRDMSEPVGGIMTLAALDLLAGNAATELIVVIGKPPAPAVGERIRAKLAGIGKLAVVCLLGRDVTA